MDFIFQEGDFYNTQNDILEWVKWIVTSIVAVAAAITPFLLTQHKNLKKEFEQLKQVEAFYFLLVENLVKNSYTQAKHLIQFSDNLKSKTVEHKSLRIEPGLLIDKIDNLSKDPQLYKAIVVGKNTEDGTTRNSLKEIFNSTDAINKYIQSTREMLDAFNKKYLEAQNRWNEYGEKFIREFELKATEANKGKIEDENLLILIKRLDKIHKQWSELKTNDIEVTYKKLISPSRIASQELNEPYFLSDIMQAKAGYDEIRSLEAIFYKIFRNLGDRMNERAEMIEQNKKIIEATAFRPTREWLR